MFRTRHTSYCLYSEVKQYTSALHNMQPDARHDPRPRATYMRGSAMGVGCMSRVGRLLQLQFTAFKQLMDSRSWFVLVCSGMLLKKSIAYRYPIDRHLPDAACITCVDANIKTPFSNPFCSNVHTYPVFSLNIKARDSNK